MKNTLVLLSILFTGISTFAQQSDQNEIKGKWTLPGGRDAGISLNFMDSNKMYFTFGDSYRWNGNYKYRIAKLKSDFVIILLPYDEIRKDSLQISVTNLTEDSFQLKSIIHYYTDGRPPESELSEGHTYILRRQKITNQG